MLRGRIAVLRQLLFWIALGPFLALAMIAPGTMATAGTDGRVSLVLCTGDGPLEVFVDPDGSVGPDSVPSHEQDEYRSCAWALHAQPLLDAPTLTSICVGTATSAADKTPDLPEPVLKRFDLSTSARGPPLAA